MHWTREVEKEAIADRESNVTSWEKVVKMVDLKEKAGAAADTSRMRQLFLQLKHTPI